MTGRTETYDFDEWTRAHYSHTFQQKNFKDEKLKQKKHNVDIGNDFNKVENSMFGGITLFILVLALFTWIDGQSHDDIGGFRKRT